MSFLIKDQKNLIQFVINEVFGIFGVSADVKKAFDSKLVDNNPCREETKIFTINKSLMQFLIILVS